MEINHNDVHQILKIVDSAEHLDEIELVVDGLQLHIRRSPSTDVSASTASRTAPMRVVPSPSSDRATQDVLPEKAPPSLPAPGVSSSEQHVPEGMVAIRAPMLGSFYRSPSPGEDPFVQVGKSVKAVDTLGLIEVMKLFSSISAGVDGVVAEILAKDGDLVEYNQVLFLLKPNKLEA